LGVTRRERGRLTRWSFDSQVTSAIDSLMAGMESLQSDRMLAAWAPGVDVLHVSDR
jgi:hypothetical protein